MKPRTSSPCSHRRAVGSSRYSMGLPHNSAAQWGRGRCPQPTHPLFLQVFDVGSDAIAVHAIGVLTAIMSNSPSAKVGEEGGRLPAQLGLGFFFFFKLRGVLGTKQLVPGGRCRARRARVFAGGVQGTHRLCPPLRGAEEPGPAHPAPAPGAPQHGECSRGFFSSAGILQGNNGVGLCLLQPLLSPPSPCWVPVVPIPRWPHCLEL